MMLKSTLAKEELTGLEYQYYIPPNCSPFAKPIYLIHGRGGNSDVMWVFSKAFVSLNRPIFAPQAPVPDLEISGWNWWKLGDKINFSEKVLELDQFFKNIEKCHGLKGAPRTLCGFSQGAALAVMYTLLLPQKIGEVICLGGFIPKSFIYNPQELTGVRLFAGHGINDQIIPLNRADDVCEVFSLLDAEITKSYTDVGHKVGSLTINDLTEWNLKSNVSVSIFDDDLDVHEALSSILMDYGIKHYSAHNQQEAFELLKYKSSLFIVDLFIEGSSSQTTDFVKQNLIPFNLPFVRYSSAPHLIEANYKGLAVFPKQLKVGPGSIKDFIIKNFS